MRSISKSRVSKRGSRARAARASTPGGGADVPSVVPAAYRSGCQLEDAVAIAVDKVPETFDASQSKVVISGLLLARASSRHCRKCIEAPDRVRSVRGLLVAALRQSWRRASTLT